MITFNDSSLRPCSCRLNNDGGWRIDLSLCREHLLIVKKEGLEVKVRKNHDSIISGKMGFQV